MLRRERYSLYSSAEQRSDRHVKTTHECISGMITVEKVRHIASLARLRLTDGEEKVLAKEMADILQYVEKLHELDTTGVEPMTHPFEMQGVWRQDTVNQNSGHFRGVNERSGR